MNFLKFDYGITSSSTFLEYLKLGKDIILIKNFPNDDKVLKDFINEIGKPIIDFRSGDEIFKVTADKTQNDFECFANNTKEFSVHTDCSDFNPMPNGLAMFLEQPAKRGGESLFINVNTIINSTTEFQREILTTKLWNFRKFSKTILELREKEKYHIRYNRVMLSSYCDMNEQDYIFLNNFDKLLARDCMKIKLEANDLVLCNNSTILHGRTTFESNKRVVKRIRFVF